MAISNSERDLMVSKYRDLLSTCKPVLQKGDSAFIRDAMNLALRHGLERRTSAGEPAVLPGMDLAEILASEMGLGKIPVAAALLREGFLEGTITPDEIRTTLGPSLLTLLEGILRLSSLKIEKAQQFSENFIRLFISISKDIRVIFLQLAATLYDLRRADRLPRSLQTQKAREAYFLYAPLAHRLGLYRVKTELEDLSMRILFAEEHERITAKLAETTDARNDFIARFIYPIEQELKRQGFTVDIKGRPKSVHSIWTKMKKQQVPFEEVYDILAVRIVLHGIRENEKADCWKVYSIVTDLYPPNPARLRDWISAPKASGYEALHTTVEAGQGKWVEVQIRTERMDEIAEKGRVAHWRYKENKISGESEEWLSSLRDLVENPGPTALGDDESGRIDAVDPHIFVFTPQGDLKQLPPGSTLLDFAFTVHSDLGMRCTGGLVNGKNAPLRQVLQNGDEVVIHTSKNQKPNKDWLSFIVSPRARQRIRKVLREEELKESEVGKEMLLRKLRNWKIPMTDDILDKAVKLLKFKTHSDLYYAIAIGMVDPLKVKEALVQEAKAEGPALVEGQRPAPKKTAHVVEDYIFLDQHLVNINYTLASCCNPIVGDRVFGFVTVSKGLSVHRVNCPNAKDLLKRYNYRVVKVKWRESLTTTAFQASIRLQGIDQVGILNTISEVISREMETNIRSVTIETSKGIFRGTIKVHVRDTKHLETILHRLAKIKGVLKATRAD